ncbi:hypothetical protein [Leuconostoc inhae]|uniref:hypothetical protein n=1 Tax=Leuconostoc inhae TaxID=178001 RepID=UPI0002193A9E|nr:hypothetical protein [Leuconostoc inhae]
MKNHNKFEQLDKYQKITDSDLQYVTGGFNQGAYDAGKKVGKIVKLGGLTYKIIKYGKYLA